MPRFFFHLHDGQTYHDEIGEEFACLIDARRHAVKYAAEVLQEKQELFWSGGSWKLDITDRSGFVLATMLFVGLNWESVKLAE